MSRLCAVALVLNSAGLLAWTWGLPLDFDLVQFLALNNVVFVLLALRHG